MSDWDLIADEAEVVARRLRQDAVDLAEAEKAIDYFAGQRYSEEKMRHYLTLLSQNPPVRSKRSVHHYRNLQKIWQSWQTPLTGQDKARAWGWGVRLAKTSN